jgi:hypothetical protein
VPNADYLQPATTAPLLGDHPDRPVRGARVVSFRLLLGVLAHWCPVAAHRLVDRLRLVICRPSSTRPSRSSSVIGAAYTAWAPGQEFSQRLYQVTPELLRVEW